MARSAHEWAELVAAPLMQLRAEIWKALNNAKDGGGGHEKLSWPELVRRWRPKEEDTRTVEARWRNGLDTDEIAIDIMDIGEALQALYAVRERVAAGKTPRVRRLLYDEPDPADRMLKIFHPDVEVKQDVSGLLGTWRLVHQQSDGKGFMSWRVAVDATVESHGGPGAWFKMETKFATNTPRRRGNGVPSRTIPHSVRGAVHGVNAMFYLLGTDPSRQVVTASFEAPRGQLPANYFDRAHGLIQRTGASGLYAARAVLSRVDCIDESEIGRFTIENVDAGLPDGLADDIATISASSDMTGSPACLVGASDIQEL